MDSIVSVSLLSLLTTTRTQADKALAADDATVVVVTTATTVQTTPSVSEGELTISRPPPYRETETVQLVVGEGEDRTKADAVTTSSATIDMSSKKRAKTADPRFFVAGGASAAISHGITTPLDVVKTRMQSDTVLGDCSVQEAAAAIVAEDGPKALTVGLGPTVVGYGIQGGLKFGVYESLKPIFLTLFGSTTVLGMSINPSGLYVAAAIVAGAVASLVLCPMEETRIRLVTDPTWGANGLIDGLPKLLREEGFLSPFNRGLAPMLSKQVPYTMGKQVSFDLFAAILYGAILSMGLTTWLPQNEIALGVEVGAAFLASIVACLASHPGDVLLTATYKEDFLCLDGGLGATIDKVYKQGGGISAFFRGLNARFLHVACIITLQLVIYDQLKQLLGLPAIGLPGT